MNRTQIYLNPGQQKVLRVLAAERLVTISQLIREAIDELIARLRKSEEHPSRGLKGIIGICRNDGDRQGSIHHDDLYD